MHRCNDICSEQISRLKPSRFAIYNDDIYLGQNFLLSPLINVIHEIFPNSVIHLIIPKDIHYLWESGRYKVIIDDLYQSHTKNYDVVLGLTKKNHSSQNLKV